MKVKIFNFDFHEKIHQWNFNFANFHTKDIALVIKVWSKDCLSNINSFFFLLFLSLEVKYETKFIIY